MSRTRAVVQRVLHAVALIVGVIVLNFVLIHVAPGDPAHVIAGEMGGASEETLAQLRAAYGLDKSVPEQLVVYAARMLSGDLGRSFYFNAPVSELVAQRVPATLLLIVSAVVVALVGGVALGVLAALRPHGVVAHVVTIVSLFGYAAPVFWVAVLLILLLGSVIPLFPVSGMYDVARGGGPLARALDILHHLVLPVVSLAIIYVAQYSRLVRATTIEALRADYVRTARGKGLDERSVVLKHALRNAILPVVTIAGMHFGQLFAGAVLVETVFSWPGMGRLAHDSILRRDHPTILGILFFSAVLVILANALTDTVYRLVDPRIRTARS